MSGGPDKTLNQADWVKRWRPTAFDELPVVTAEVVLTAYQYDRMGKLERACHVMPLRHSSGISYELPNRTTLNAPPQVEEGCVPVYIPTTGRWLAVEDHRGEMWLDWGGRPVEIKRLGDPEKWGLRRQVEAVRQ